jgi:Kdo2-lipid IVA lauroyltransferase/acyltransferase
VNTIIRAILGLISLLPLPVARALGALIGQLAWLVKSAGSRTALINLQHCFPHLNPHQVRRLAARSMRHWGMTLFEIPVVWRRASRGFSWIREVQGAEVLDRAVARAKGIIFVSPHLGNWEFMGLWAGGRGPMTTLYQPPRRFNLDALLQQVRAKTGATLVPTNARGVASLIKALRNGHNVGILPDMVPPSSGGVFAPFFRLPAMTMTLIHSLAVRSEAAVIICFARRTRGGFTIVITEPGGDIYSADPAVSAGELNRTIEVLIEQAPEQYQWEYKRFKRDPDGSPSIYEKAR